MLARSHGFKRGTLGHSGENNAGKRGKPYGIKAQAERAQRPVPLIWQRLFAPTMGFPVGPAAAKARIWMNGELIPWDQAKIHVMTHALHYGSGVFEGIRAYETKRGPAIFRLSEHLDRFLLSAKVYHMEYKFNKAQLADAVKSVVKVNGLKSAYIRPIAFVGYGRLGVMPTGLPIDIAIGAWEWGSYLGEEALEKGVRIALSPWRRIKPDALPVSAKASGQYISSILGAYVARKNGYHEALFLDDLGHVSEGSGENFFIVKDEVVYTPDSSSSILEGITRDSVMTIARDLGYKVVEKKLVMGDVFGADEAFFTGTAAEVTPIREIEDRSVGDGTVGPVTKKLQDIYFKTVRGETAKYEKWLTYVN